MQRLDVTGYRPAFTAHDANAYANDTYRAGVDAIARNAGKMSFSVVATFPDGSTAPADPTLEQLLNVRPNPLITGYDLVYKLVTHLYTRNNAFAYLDRNASGQVVGIYPLTVSSVDFLTDTRGTVFARFTYPNGKRYTFAYDDVIHLRRHFNESDVMGEGNDAIDAALSLAHAQNEGMVEGIKNSAVIRGILKFTQLLGQEKLKAQRDAFIADYLDMGNNGGLAVTDASMDYVPIEATPANINSAEIQTVASKIYSYLGVSEPIVRSSYTDEQWSSFEESVIEPLALQMSQEFTSKVLTPAQVAAGTVVRVGIQRLQFISNENKIKLLHEVVPMGLITVNQALDIMGYPPVPDGERRIQSLNYVDLEIASNYQLVRSGSRGLQSLAGEQGETEATQ